MEEKFGCITSNFEHEVLSVLALTCDEGSVTNERLRYSLNLHKGQISEIVFITSATNFLGFNCLLLSKIL